MPNADIIPEDPTKMWDIVSAVATAAAAAFAGWQIRQSRIDANRRAAFEHIREIEHRLQVTWSFSREEARDEVLAYFRGNRADLPPAGSAFLALLNSLDVLAFARQKKMVASELVDEHTSTLIDPKVIPLTFLKELQEACGDAKVYEHLYSYLKDALPKQIAR